MAMNLLPFNMGNLKHKDTNNKGLQQPAAGWPLVVR
jgi:hypothetical protein